MFQSGWFINEHWSIFTIEHDDFAFTKIGNMILLQWQMLVCQANIAFLPSNMVILQSIIVKLVCSDKWKMLKPSATIQFWIWKQRQIMFETFWDHQLNKDASTDSGFRVQNEIETSMRTWLKQWNKVKHPKSEQRTAIFSTAWHCTISLPFSHPKNHAQTQNLSTHSGSFTDHAARGYQSSLILPDSAE